MICRRCGNRIPEHLAVRESFKCPECGRQFGTPTPEREPRYDSGSRYEPRSRYQPDDRYGSRYDSRDRYAQEDRYASGSRDSRGRYEPDDRYEYGGRDSRRSRYEPEPEYVQNGYDGGYDDRYAGGQGYDDGYYYEEDQPYEDDGYYYEEDQPYEDDGYYYGEDQPYDDGGYYYEEDQLYADEDLSDFVGGRPAGMKLTTVLAVVLLGILVVAAVYFIDGAIHPGEAQLAARTLLDGAEYFV